MLEKLRRRIPDARDTGLLNDLLEAAADMILAYTGRDEVPDGLRSAQVSLAAVLYNRMGIEGEAAHSEGGVSRSVEMMPEDLRHQLNAWRLAKAVRL